MVAQLAFFLDADDERTLLRDLAPLGFELYPRVAEPGFCAPPVDETLAGSLDTLGDGEEFYFAIPELGDVPAHEIKRGPNRGRMILDEIAGNVVFYGRSRLDDEGQLRSGKMWAEIEVGGDLRRVGGKSSLFRHRVDALLAAFKKRARRSDPPGFWVGPHAARLAKAGKLVLREAGRKGGLVALGRD